MQVLAEESVSNTSIAIPFTNFVRECEICAVGKSAKNKHKCHEKCQHLPTVAYDPLQLSRLTGCPEEDAPIASVANIKIKKSKTARKITRKALTSLVVTVIL